ncbi:MAG TPA: isoaspartyl peptidase/L-asparaginase [Planctomycetota bacterium]|nr:isoaspartyl peptidase/L-asparaginase [Planctomycetota bacterium]
MRNRSSSWLSLAMWSLAAGCAASGTPAAATWAIAIHGGAGTLDRTAPGSQLQEYRDVLDHALAFGRERLARGDRALDVCEAVVRLLEDDPHFNAGRGAVFNEKGEHELDACIMDGATMRCGAVAGVRTVKNPIGLARLVMERTPHVLLMGDGAEQFATATSVDRVDNSYFDTAARRRSLEEVLRERQRTGAAEPRRPEQRFGTVGCVAKDQRGELAAATSTGGLTGKRWGRVGDSPIVGAGTYADAWVAVSGTGTGEQFIRHTVARTIAARMQFGGQTLAEAANAVVFETLDKDDGGVIAVDRDGNLAAPFNSGGMYRALADSRGRYDVRIFED